MSSEEAPRRMGIPFNYRTPEKEAALMRRVRQNPKKRFLYAKCGSASGAACLAGKYRKHRQPTDFRVKFTTEKRDDGEGCLSFVYVQFVGDWQPTERAPAIDPYVELMEPAAEHVNAPHWLQSNGTRCSRGEPIGQPGTELDHDQIVELYALHVSTFRNAAFVEAMIERYEAKPMVGRWDLEELRDLIEATIKAGF